MKLESRVFKNQARIPTEYTCDGADISPPLNISDVPGEAKSLVLIMDDPDSPSGNFTHWLLWNISVEKGQIEEDFMADEEVEGTNDFGNVGYGGPCPGSGVHRYFFKLFALDKKLDLPTTTTQEELETQMEDHIVDEVELVGLYGK